MVDCSVSQFIHAWALLLSDLICSMFKHIGTMKRTRNGWWTEIGRLVFTLIQGSFTFSAQAWIWFTMKSNLFNECEHECAIPFTVPVQVRCGSNHAQACHRTQKKEMYSCSIRPTITFKLKHGCTQYKLVSACVLKLCKPSRCISPPTILGCVLHMQGCPGTEQRY